MDLFVTDSFNVQTQTAGYNVQGEVVPDQVLTFTTADHVIVLTCRAREDIDPIVADYDSESASSPSAGDSRSIARPIVAHLAAE